MKIAAAVLFSVLVLAFGALAPGRALGQTTSPPTPTATPAIPAGADLITQMTQAIQAKNSYHAVLTVKVTAPDAGNLKLRMVIDQSIKPARAHELTTVTGKSVTNTGATKKINQHLTADLVGKHFAIRQGKKAWQCTTTAQATAAIGSIFPTGSMPFQNATNLGAVTVNGSPAWHVSATTSLDLGSLSPSLGSAPITVPVDFYIAQSDFTLLRETTSIDESVSGITVHETATEKFSKYGETVKVKLPSACKA